MLKPQNTDALKQKQLAARYVFIIILVTILTRIPFASATLFSWDSVQFALSLHHFDVSIHQPHPPGYILYVALGKILRYFILNDNLALVTMSVFFTLLSSLMLFVFLQRFVDSGIAFFTTLYYLLSPLVWFMGEVGLSYMAEGFFSVCVGFFSYRFMKNKNYRDLIFSTFFLGLSGGIRQNTMVFLAPLWLYAMLKGLKRDGKDNARIAKQALLHTLFLGTLTASWFVPMVMFSGGYRAYNAILRGHWGGIVMHTSFFHRGPVALAMNSEYLVEFILDAFTVGIFLLACYIYFLLRNKKAKGETSSFLLIWCIPSVLFYVLVHINYPGYVFTFIPAVFLVFAKAVEWLKKTAPRFLANAILSLIFIANPVVFLVVRGETSASAIALHDTHLNALVSSIREQFLPGKTVILSFNHIFYGFRHAMYYLPEYESYEVYPVVGYNGHARKFLGGDEFLFKNFDKISIHPGAKYVVLFSDPRLGFQVEQILKKDKTLYASLKKNTIPKRKILPSHFELHWFEVKQK